MDFNLIEVTKGNPHYCLLLLLLLLLLPITTTAATTTSTATITTHTYIAREKYDCILSMHV